jgi:hypothetical protein
VVIVRPLKSYNGCLQKMAAKKFDPSFFGVASKRDLVFIAIGELHVGRAWDIRVILFCKQIPPNIS